MRFKADAAGRVLLGPRQVKFVTVTFTPTKAGSFRGRLVISANDGQGNRTVSLSGSAK